MRANALPTNPDSYKRFARTELRRTEDGKFKPAAAEPDSIDELDSYAALQQAADSANNFVEMVDKRAEMYRNLDGTAEDLNAKSGAVAVQDLAHVYLQGPKTPVRKTFLKFDQETETVASLSQRVDGDYEDFHLEENLDAKLSDGFNIKYEQIITRGEDTENVAFLLSEQSNGNFSYEVTSRPLN